MGRQGTADARRPAGRPSQGSRQDLNLRKSVLVACVALLPRILFLCESRTTLFHSKVHRSEIKTYQGSTRVSET